MITIINVIVCHLFKEKKSKDDIEMNSLKSLEDNNKVLKFENALLLHQTMINQVIIK